MELQHFTKDKVPSVENFYGRCPNRSKPCESRSLRSSRLILLCSLWCVGGIKKSFVILMFNIIYGHAIFKLCGHLPYPFMKQRMEVQTEIQNLFFFSHKHTWIFNVTWPQLRGYLIKDNSISAKMSSLYPTPIGLV
ncbi:hypothetical protein Lalb_Chr10g0104921 [Lupinus albus]|uniref:Uncharacterized protein n=1 Tax=Lupinus albus TaxID=3870 RepID=A0A6A4PXZ5_LUPAL|nr:hypothetical protein Lalb_Chr10g0104921 [Lupinus albus]